LQGTGDAEKDGPPAGVIAGRYQLVREIGRGATGTVYEAVSLPDGRSVALKLLHARFLDNEQARRRFRREARSITLLQHPNVVRIVEAGEDGGRPYLAMELLVGRSLADVLYARAPLPFPRVSHIVRQILSVLLSVEAEGLVHRDLKPSNIILEDHEGTPDVVKVCDFGLAKVIDIRSGSEAGDTFLPTGAGALCGTPEYMSPEQILGDDVDGRSDLYAVYVMLYQLCTGELPFHGGSPWSVLARQLRDPPQPPRARRPDLVIPRRLEQLILAGLDKDRQRRPSASAFAAELDALALSDWNTLERAVPDLGRLDARAIPTILEAPAPPDAGAPTAAGRKRRSGWVPLAVAIVLVCGTGVAWLGLTRHAAHEGQSAVTAAANPAARPDPPARPKSAPAAHAQAPVPVGVVTPPKRGRATAAVRSTRTPAVREAGPPAARAMADAIAEAAELLSNGAPADACNKIEAMKLRHLTSPALYKFLGQCYMRLGRSSDAKGNYEEYLRLAPDAADAPFIAGIIR